MIQRDGLARDQDPRQRLAGQARRGEQLGVPRHRLPESRQRREHRPQGERRVGHRPPDQREGGQLGAAGPRDGPAAAGQRRRHERTGRLLGARHAGALAQAGLDGSAGPRGIPAQQCADRSPVRVEQGARLGHRGDADRRDGSAAERLDRIAHQAADRRSDPVAVAGGRSPQHAQLPHLRARDLDDGDLGVGRPDVDAQGAGHGEHVLNFVRFSTNRSSVFDS
nr:hypothetical protein [Pseudolysinimonas kribbensis]